MVKEEIESLARESKEKMEFRLVNKLTDKLMDGMDLPALSVSNYIENGLI